MKHFVLNRTAIVVATTIFSNTSVAKPLIQDGSTDEKSQKAKVAYRVLGLMKTKSGAT